MLATTEGIVLHTLKYGESSVISAIYTRNFGRQSFMINAARSKRSKNRAGILQPLFLVDLVTYQKQSREVQRVKEIKNNPTYQNIPFDMVKSAQIIFLAEMLYKTLREEEGSPELFDFLKNTLLYFDLMEKNTANFHLFLLFRLTEYLGFLPDVRKQGFENWFDLKKGEVVSFEPAHPYYIHKEATVYLCELGNLKLKEISDWKIPGRIRDYLLTKMIDYYEFHFQNLGEIKSYKVLKEVFH